MITKTILQMVHQKLPKMNLQTLPKMNRQKLVNSHPIKKQKLSRKNHLISHQKLSRQKRRRNESSLNFILLTVTIN